MRTTRSAAVAISSSVPLVKHHFEVQYSHDGGKTWQLEPAFVANLTRIGPGL